MLMDIGGVRAYVDGGGMMGVRWLRDMTMESRGAVRV